MNEKGEIKMRKTFDELVEVATQDIHSALLTGGAKEMKSAIHKWMSTAILWSKEKQK